LDANKQNPDEDEELNKIIEKILKNDVEAVKKL